MTWQVTWHSGDRFAGILGRVRVSLHVVSWKGRGYRVLVYVMAVDRETYPPPTVDLEYPTETDRRWALADAAKRWPAFLDEHPAVAAAVMGFLV